MILLIEIKMILSIEIKIIELIEIKKSQDLKNSNYCAYSNRKNKSIEKMFLVEFKFLIPSCKESFFISFSKF